MTSEQNLPFLGWLLSGTTLKIGPGDPQFEWFALNDRDGQEFSVCGIGQRPPLERSARLEAAREAALASIQGKIFLSRWTDQQSYELFVPVPRGIVHSSMIRAEILRGLMRLRELDFEPNGFQIPHEAIATELAVSEESVLAALRYLYEKGQIADARTGDSNYRLGWYWLTVEGVDALESIDAARTTSYQQDLRAILFLDIVNSTALTEQLGDAAFHENAKSALGATRELIERAGGRCEGRSQGDGILATFGSGVQAIKSALECLNDARRFELELHGGIHAGDVIADDGDVYGGAVNIAARLAGAAGASQIFVSRVLRELAGTASDVEFKELGALKLKGIEAPLAAFQIVSRSADLP